MAKKENSLPVPTLPSSPAVSVSSRAALPVLSPSCETCLFWKNHQEVIDPKNPPEKLKVGFCTRFPPTILDTVGLTSIGPLCKFPVTLSTLSCGEYKK